eukprot:CAMPEP_0115051360 /NCGR_PEP_ID=MMETSP0227-20121206/2300_1 /TAXON_ID=89957 /ORGANISM="Polarella glacialis, Strain CCMP 1383" /LENGTH=116 /DNA_ID=CAMNT_0002435325 /DNA_START=572 /DNA_END=918 /DNA_ORIENTATION=-
MLLRMPGVEKEIATAGSLGRCNNCAGGHVGSVGRTPEGSLLTVPIKVYPSRLCAVIARGFLLHARVIHEKRQTQIHFSSSAGGLSEKFRRFHVPEVLQDGYEGSTTAQSEMYAEHV